LDEGDYFSFEEVSADVVVEKELEFVLGPLLETVVAGC